MIELVNDARAEFDLDPLATCEALDRAAQDYAVVLEEWGELSHTGPDGSELRDRVALARYRGWNSVGENIASGYPNVRAVVAGWLESPGHRANILRPSYSQIGVGKSLRSAHPSPYWVQVFGAGGTC